MHHLMRPPLAAFLLYNLLTQTLSAETELLPDATLFEPDLMVNDASQIPTEREKLTVPVTVIDQEMIEASGAINVAELFRLVPGFQVGIANRGYFSVNPSAVTDRFVKLLEIRVDGIPIYDLNNNSPNWNINGIQVEDIERIEVTRAPNTVTHGFNSFMGSVNIITKNPLQQEGSEALVRVGSDDYQHYQLRHSRAFDQFSFRAGVDHKTEDGFRGLNDFVDASNFFFRGQYTPSARNKLDFGVVLGNNNFNFVYTDPIRGEPEFDFVTDQSATMEYLRWEHVRPNQDSFGIEMHHRYTVFNDTTVYPYGRNTISSIFPPGAFGFLFPGQPDEVLSYPYDSHEHRYDINVSYLYKQIKNVRWRTELGLRYEDYFSTFVRDEDKSRFSKSLFTAIDWDITSDLRINLGFATQFTNDNSPTVNPRVGFNYRLADNHHVRGNYSYVERNPGINNQYAAAIVRFSNGTPFGVIQFSDENIDNMRMHHVGLGYHGQYLNERLEVDLEVYKQEVRDGIVFFQTNIPGLTIPGNPPVLPGAFFDNTLNWNTLGLEAEIKWSLGKQAFLHVNYAYVDVYGREQTGIQPFTTTDLDDAIAKHSLGVLLAKKWQNGLSLSSAYYYQSAMRWRTESTLEKVQRLDVKAGYEYPFSDATLELNLIGQGLFGKYTELQIGNVFEPRLFLQLGIRF